MVSTLVSTVIVSVTPANENYLRMIEESNKISIRPKLYSLHKFRTGLSVNGVCKIDKQFIRADFLDLTFLTSG